MHLSRKTYRIWLWQFGTGSSVCCIHLVLFKSSSMPQHSLRYTVYCKWISFALAYSLSISTALTVARQISWTMSHSGFAVLKDHTYPRSTWTTVCQNLIWQPNYRMLLGHQLSCRCSRMVPSHTRPLATCPPSLHQTPHHLPSISTQHQVMIAIQAKTTGLSYCSVS